MNSKQEKDAGKTGNGRSDASRSHKARSQKLIKRRAICKRLQKIPFYCKLLQMYYNLRLSATCLTLRLKGEGIIANAAFLARKMRKSNKHYKMHHYT